MVSTSRIVLAAPPASCSGSSWWRSGECCWQLTLSDLRLPRLIRRPAAPRARASDQHRPGERDSGPNSGDANLEMHSWTPHVFFFPIPSSPTLCLFALDADSPDVNLGSSCHRTIGQYDIGKTGAISHHDRRCGSNEPPQGTTIGFAALSVFD